MYAKSSALYDRCYHFKDYDSEAETLLRLIRARFPGASTLLELACGTGKFLSMFQKHFYVEGLDVNPELLAIARSRCPNAALHLGRMQTFDLDRRFDVIACLFSSIAYVKTKEGLTRTLVSISRHLSSHGIIIIEPWLSPDEFFLPYLKMNIVDDDDLKIVWMYRHDRVENIAILNIYYVVGTIDGVDSFTELHELGLFTQEDYQDAFFGAGLDVEFCPMGKHGFFIGRRADI